MSQETLRQLRFVSMATFSSVMAAMAFAVGASSGCTAQQQATGSDAGASAADGGAASTGTTCLEILKCIGDCPDSDAKCPDTCAEKGTPDGQSTLLALATCVDKEKCTTGPCVTEKCADSLKACVDSSNLKPAETPPLVGDAPPGSVPTDLVGEWAATTDGNGGRLILNADGSGSWFHGFSYTGYPDGSSTSCLVIGSTTWTGNVVVGESPPGAPPGGPPWGAMTVYATSVVKSFRNCSGSPQNTNEPATTKKLQWYRDYDGSGYDNLADPNTIFIIDSDCAAKYPDASRSVALYCTTRVRRR